MCKEMEALYNQGIANGEKIGERRGEKRGEKKMAVLIERLMDSGRMEDCRLVAKDATYRRQLMKELNI